MRKRYTRKTKDYEVYAIGADGKIIKKCTLQADSEDEAQNKAKMFTKVAGVTFSHTKQIIKI